MAPATPHGDDTARREQQLWARSRSARRDVHVAHRHQVLDAARAEIRGDPGHQRDDRQHDEMARPACIGAIDAMSSIVRVGTSIAPERWL